MKKSKKFSNLVEKSNGFVVSDGVHNKPVGANRNMIKDEEYDLTPDFRQYFTKTILTTKPMNKQINSTQQVIYFS